MTQTQSPLGKKLTNGAGKAPTPGSSPLGRSLGAGPRGELVELAYLGPARLELVGNLASQEIEGEMYRALEQLGIPLNAVTADRYELERAVRTLARAVRDAEDRTRPFGTLAEWQAVDTDVIAACWSAYGNLRERFDPMDIAVTEAERSAIESAVKKKDALLLRSFGAAKLSAWLVSTDGPPQISPQPSSPNSGSSQDS